MHHGPNEFFTKREKQLFDGQHWCHWVLAIWKKKVNCKEMTCQRPPQRSAPNHFPPTRGQHYLILLRFAHPPLCVGAFSQTVSALWLRRETVCFATQNTQHLSCISKSFWRKKNNNKIKAVTSHCLVVFGGWCEALFGWLGVFTRWSMRCKIKIMIFFFRINENEKIYQYIMHIIMIMMMIVIS